ncbi:hypothetical protein [Hymenobacter negativus]|uniref:Uncharacterized protein n=1 Tax=Hymenobacter negativus TaxID=2795026 RepID=A0ABS0Q6Z3_9BACT|nr:hypothetical protein [Hymenobacter negativus]MBH8558436.1 hypothetical protein [Hymenobacter negativus]
MKRFLFFYYLKRVLSSGYTWASLTGLFFIGCGWLMERNGASEFQFADKYGKAQSGSPGLLYWLGGSILALAAVRAVLFQLEATKEFRAKNDDTLLPNN